MIDKFLLLYVITLAGKLKPNLKANLNGHPSIMSFNPDLNQAQKCYIFMENDKIISLTNLLSAIVNVITIFSEKFQKSMQGTN